MEQCSIGARTRSVSDDKKPARRYAWRVL